MSRMLSDIFDRVEKKIGKEPLPEVAELSEKTPSIVEFLPAKMIENGDIFDRIAKDVKLPSLKKYTPAERVELSRAVVHMIQSEVFRNMPKSEKVVEIKGPDEAKIEALISRSVFQVVGKITDMQAKHDNSARELAEIRREYKELKQLLEASKKNPDIELRVLAAPFPDMSNKSGQYLTNENNTAKWGPIAAVGVDGVIPIGDQDTDGSWRIIVSGNDLAVQKLVSGSWAEKGAFEA